MGSYKVRAETDTIQRWVSTPGGTIERGLAVRMWVSNVPSTWRPLGNESEPGTTYPVVTVWAPIGSTLRPDGDNELRWPEVMRSYKTSTPFRFEGIDTLLTRIEGFGNDDTRPQAHKEPAFVRQIITLCERWYLVHNLAELIRKVPA